MTLSRKQLKENRVTLYDFIIVGSVITLMVLGILTLRSVVYQTPSEGLYKKQIIWDILALGAMFYFWLEKEKRLVKLSKFIYYIAVVSLVLVLLIGKRVYGAKRWIDLGFFDYQPSELFKIGIILSLSHFFANERSKKKAFYFSLLYLLPAGLIFVQPDLGMTILMGFIWYIMLIASDVDKKYPILIAISMPFLAVFAFFFVLDDYQKSRIISIISPEKYFHTGAFNVIMSKTVAGSGGVFGSGYMTGLGTNSRIVPMQHTDFIYSAFAEQFGLIGSLAIVSLYLIILLGAVLKIGKYKSKFWEFFALGVSSVFTFHVFENIGMNLGLLPVTGIPLPFISYGGTSTIVFGALIGLLLKARATSYSWKGELL